MAVPSSPGRQTFQNPMRPNQQTCPCDHGYQPTGVATKNLAGKPPGFESSSSGNSTQESLLKPRTVCFCVFFGGGGRGGGGAEVGSRYLPCIPQWHFHSTGWGLPHPGMTALQGSTFSPLPSSLGIICDLKQGRTRIRRTSFYELLSRFFLPNHKKHWGWCPGSLCA